MATEAKTKKAHKNKNLTVRQRSEQAPVQKRRLVRSTVRGASRPFRVLGSFAAKVFKKLFRPLRFLLWPFKTRPARFVGRMLATIFFLRYFRNSWKELRQVSWPNRKETWQLTLAVFMFAIVFGLIITVTDYGLDKLFRKVILK